MGLPNRLRPRRRGVDTANNTAQCSVLCTPELLSNILGYLEYKSLTRCARVDHLWFLEAARLIWSGRFHEAPFSRLSVDQEDRRQFCDEFNSGSVVSLRGLSLMKDSARFDFYRTCVRGCWYRSGGFDSYANHKLLRSLPGGGLCPQMQEFSVQLANHSAPLALPAAWDKLLPRDLKTMIIQLSDARFAEMDVSSEQIQALYRLLNHLVTSCPALANLRLLSIPPNIDWTVLHRFSTKTKVSVVLHAQDTFSVKSLQCIAQMGTLHQLCAIATCSFEQCLSAEFSKQDSPFRSLKELHVRGSTLELASLLPHLSHLSRLTVSICNAASETNLECARQTWQAIIAMGDLEELEVIYSDLDQAEGNHWHLVVSWFKLLAVSCPKLSKLKIRANLDTGWMDPLNDQDLFHVLQNLPRLTSFALGRASWRYPTPEDHPILTFQTFENLSRTCRDLRRIELPHEIDLTQFTTWEGGISAFPNVQVLVVKSLRFDFGQDLPVKSLPDYYLLQVIDIITQHFPKLERLAVAYAEQITVGTAPWTLQIIRGLLYPARPTVYGMRRLARRGPLEHVSLQYEPRGYFGSGRIGLKFPTWYFRVD